MSIAANIIVFLSAQQSKQALPLGADDSPAKRILRAVRDADLLPITELSDRTGLQPQVCADTVERLRRSRQVELIARPSDPRTRYLRLAPAGYAVSRA